MKTHNEVHAPCEINNAQLIVTRKVGLFYEPSVKLKVVRTNYFKVLTISLGVLLYLLIYVVRIERWAY